MNKIFKFEFTGKTLAIAGGVVAFGLTCFGLGRLSKKSSKKDLHEMAEQPKPAQEQPQAPAAAAPQPQA